MPKPAGQLAKKVYGEVLRASLDHLHAEDYYGILVEQAFVYDELSPRFEHFEDTDQEMAIVVAGAKAMLDAERKAQHLRNEVHPGEDHD